MMRVMIMGAIGIGRFPVFLFAFPYEAFDFFLPFVVISVVHLHIGERHGRG
jgi:hypothetical protein